MSEVQRYQVLPGSQYSGTMDQIPSCDGEYVLYSDYADLQAKLSAVQAVADSLAEAAKHLIYFHMCELEGLAAGKPTPEQWMQAVRMVEENIAAYQASKEKP